MKISKKISAKLSYYGLRAFETLLALVPVSLVWRLGACIGSVVCFLTAKRRKIVRYNLSTVHPELSESELDKKTRKVFRNSFANLLSSIKTGSMPTKKIPTVVDTENLHIVEEINKDKPALFLLFHMSNWELISRATVLFKLHRELGSMYRPLNNPYIDDYVSKTRHASGCILFSRRKGLKDAHKFLAQGNGLGILADQNSGKSGLPLPLFNKQTSITPMPAALAKKYKCPIIPAALITSAPGKWTLKFYNAITLPEDINKQDATKLLIPVMEDIMREHSDDMFWLHDLWKIKHEL